MKYFLNLMIGSLFCVGIYPALASQGTFDRTLKLNGPATLHILNGAGNIRIMVGATNLVRILGRVTDLRVKGSRLAAQEDRMHQLAANPPIQQSGNIIQVGFQPERLANLKIDYEIEAPPNARLDAATADGDIQDDGVGESARLVTKSGNINATGMPGVFTIESESGDIVADSAGTGEVRIKTGSGRVELHNITGALNANSISGDIKLDGQPKSGWQVTDDAGSVEYWSGQAPVTLDAQNPTGRIYIDGKFETLHKERESLLAKLHGGGTEVHIRSQTGEIRVH